MKPHICLDKEKKRKEKKRKENVQWFTFLYKDVVLELHFLKKRICPSLS
jgi:hypothetical protein